MNRLAFRVRQARWLLLAVGAMLWLSGCATTDPENLTDRPWNSPKGWETGYPGGMFDQPR